MTSSNVPETAILRNPPEQFGPATGAGDATEPGCVEIALPDGSEPVQPKHFEHGYAEFAVFAPYLAKDGGIKPGTTNLVHFRRGISLLYRHCDSIGLDPSHLEIFDPVEFVDYALSLKPGVTSSTWRAYRQSLLAVLHAFSFEGVEQALQMVSTDYMDTANAEAQTLNFANLAIFASQAAAVPENGFSKVELDTAIRFLSHSTKSTFRHILIDWMVAGVSTGLLPDEWKLTSIDFYEDEAAPNGCWIWLFVLDPAGVDVDGNGILRTIDISKFRDETVQAIMRMSENGQAWFEAGEFTRFKQRCGQLLKFACGKSFKPTAEGQKPPYTLHSLRRQFVENSLSVSGHDVAATLAGNGMSKDYLDRQAGFTKAWDPEDLCDIAAALDLEVDACANQTPP